MGFKKIVSVVMSALTVSSSLVIPAGEASAAVATSSNISNNTVFTRYDSFYREHKSAIDYIINNLANSSSNNELRGLIDISSQKFEVKTTDGAMITNYIETTHPELFYAQLREFSNKHITKLDSKGEDNGYDRITKFVKNFTYNKTTRDNYINKFESQTKWYLDYIKDQKSIKAKADALYSLMKKKLTYVDARVNQSENDLSYQAMVSFKGTSLSFAKIYSYVLSRSGVKNYIDDRKRIVKVDGYSYNWEKSSINYTPNGHKYYNSNANRISVYQPFYNKYSSAINAIAQAASKYDGSVDLSKYNLDNFKQSYRTQMASDKNHYSDKGIGDATMKTILYKSIRILHPELFYIEKIDFKFTGQKITSATITYKHSQLTCDELRARFDNKTKWYLNKINSSMSEFEKALVLHDELCVNMVYYGAGAGEDNPKIDMRDLVYNAIVDGYGTCYAYSEAYSYLLSKAGVNTEIFLRKGHQLNKVQIDGNYYIADLTFDDNTEYHTVEYNDFLLSSQKWKEKNKSIYDTQVTYKNSTSTKYDNAYFHNSTRRMTLFDHKLYFVENHWFPDEYKYRVVEYDWKTDKVTKIIRNLGKSWKKDSKSSESESCSYSNTALYYGLIYFNTPNEIYAYDLYEKTTQKISNKNNNDFFQVYGIVIENDNLYGLFANYLNVNGFEKRYICKCKKSIRDSFNITLSNSSIDLKSGFSKTLTAKVTPSNISNKTVTWKSSNTNVASVTSSGIVTAKNAGTVKIAVSKTYYGRTVSKDCTVRVSKLPAPSNFTASTKTNSSITFKWNTVQNAEGYLIKTKDVTANKDLANQFTASNTITINNLNQNHKYRFALSAYKVSRENVRYYGVEAIKNEQPIIHLSNCSAALEKTTYYYTKNTIKPNVKYVKDQNGNTLKNGVDFTITYGTNRYCGTGSVILTGKGKYNGTKTLSFTIKANTPEIKNLKTVSKSGTQVTVSWDNISVADGYSCTVADSTGKTLKIKDVTTNSFTYTVPKKNSTYTFKVRSIEKDYTGSNIYGKFAALSVNV